MSVLLPSSETQGQSVGSGEKATGSRFNPSWYCSVFFFFFFFRTPECLIWHKYWTKILFTSMKLLKVCATWLQSAVWLPRWLLIDSNFLIGPHLWREQKQSKLTALQWRLKTTDIRSSSEGGLFSEQISMQKNAINLNCKFAFINYMY